MSDWDTATPQAKQFTEPGVTIVQGDALALDLPNDSVDLVVTSPPYFGLRSYQDGGEHYDGQIGAEATPAEFVDALIAATREMVRVVKPSGSIWVNLGDKYSQTASEWQGSRQGAGVSSQVSARHSEGNRFAGVAPAMGRPKSLIGIPWRYALRCIDDLGLILRAEVIWSKPNGLPESVKDRVRRSHETWFHFTLSPRYFSAVDEIREEHLHAGPWGDKRGAGYEKNASGHMNGDTPHPLGKLPGSVWTIPTQPLRVPDHLGIAHFAAFPMEWPRRIITGWSPRGVCVECGEGRRPVVERERMPNARGRADDSVRGVGATSILRSGATGAGQTPPTIITGYACACPEPTAPTTPGVVLDPFGGTGTTALVAEALGRHGISNDLSADYCRLARWRTSDPKQRDKAASVGGRSPRFARAGGPMTPEQRVAEELSDPILARRGDNT